MRRRVRLTNKTKQYMGVPVKVPLRNTGYQRVEDWANSMEKTSQVGEALEWTKDLMTKYENIESSITSLEKAVRRLAGENSYGRESPFSRILRGFVARLSEIQEEYLLIAKKWLEDSEAELKKRQ